MLHCFIRLRLWLLILCSLLLSSCLINDLSFREGIKSFQVQNYRRAFVRLKPEAQRGNPEAQYAVGYMYYYGQGVVENREKACCWIAKAAKAGQKDAILAMKGLAQSCRAASKNKSNN